MHSACVNKSVYLNIYLLKTVRGSIPHGINEIEYLPWLFAYKSHNTESKVKQAV